MKEALAMELVSRSMLIGSSIGIVIASIISTLPVGLQCWQNKVLVVVKWEVQTYLLLFVLVAEEKR